MYGTLEDSQDNKIDSRRFYGNYYGHPLEHLRTLLDYLRSNNERILIFLAGRNYSIKFITNNIY
jgi:hypothetical protein